MLQAVILALLTIFLYFWLKRTLGKNFMEIKNNYAQAKDGYDKLLFENANLKKENADLEMAAHETIALFDITKEICKSLDVDTVFVSFKEQLGKYIKLRDCKFLKGGVDLAGYSNYTILPLNIENHLIGHLAAEGIGPEDKDKFYILAQQFLLGVKRAFLYARIQQLAIVDSLTGVFSRRYCLERLQEEMARSKKFKHNFSFLMLDIDHFKNYNDRYGHLVGDAILREVASTIKENIRQIDLAGRYGGEEFSIIFPETDKAQAGFAAERIRRAIEDEDILAYDEKVKVTASIGISTYPGDAQDSQAIIDRADQALYQAKQAGRNRVCAYEAKK